MADAYIYDACRTPRGRGKSDGSLREVTPIALATGILQAVRDRNQLDTTLVDDVVFGVVSPFMNGRQHGVGLRILRRRCQNSLVSGGTLVPVRDEPFERAQIAPGVHKTAFAGAHKGSASAVVVAQAKQASAECS